MRGLSPAMSRRMKRVTFAACVLPCGSEISDLLRLATRPPVSVSQIWPVVAFLPGSIAIEFVAGYTNPDLVPAKIKSAVIGIRMEMESGTAGDLEVVQTHVRVRVERPEMPAVRPAVVEHIGAVNDRRSVVALAGMARGRSFAARSKGQNSKQAEQYGVNHQRLRKGSLLARIDRLRHDKISHKAYRVEKGDEKNQVTDYSVEES